MTKKLEAPDKVSLTCGGWSGAFLRKDCVAGWGAAWQDWGSGSPASEMSQKRLSCSSGEGGPASSPPRGNWTRLLRK